MARGETRKLGPNAGGTNLVTMTYTPIAELRKLSDSVGQTRSSTDEGRNAIRMSRLIKARRINEANLAESGHVEWNFALVKMIDDVRVVQKERRQMTQRIADLKNKTMEGTGKQWCRIN